jgi:mRNA interferase MazF
MVDQSVLDQVSRFLGWMPKKVKIHFSNRGEVYFEEREIWWASLGENIGSEANGKNVHFERPVVVLKKLSRDMLLAIPTTTKVKNGTWYHRFHFAGHERRAMLSQVRAISSKRLVRKMGALTLMDFKSLQDEMVGFIKTEPPTHVRGSSDPSSRRRDNVSTRYDG